MKKLSREINFESTFLGLNIEDLLFIVGFYLISEAFLVGTTFDLLPLVSSFGLGVILIPIRLKYRRGKVFDAFKSYLRKFLKGY